jgi:hypothetical protein
MEEKPKHLRDIIYDALFEARNGLRVAPTKPLSEGATSYFCSFMLNVDPQTQKRLVEIADKQERSVQLLLCRYIRDSFRQ